MENATVERSPFLRAFRQNMKARTFRKYTTKMDRVWQPTTVDVLNRRGIDGLISYCWVVGHRCWLVSYCWVVGHRCHVCWLGHWLHDRGLLRVRIRGRGRWVFRSAQSLWRGSNIGEGGCVLHSNRYRQYMQNLPRTERNGGGGAKLHLHVLVVGFPLAMAEAQDNAEATQNRNRH